MQDFEDNQNPDGHDVGDHNHPLQEFTLDHDCSTTVFAVDKDENVRVFVDLDVLLINLTALVVENGEQAEQTGDMVLAIQTEGVRGYALGMVDVADYFREAFNAQREADNAHALLGLPTE